MWCGCGLLLVERLWAFACRKVVGFLLVGRLWALFVERLWALLVGWSGLFACRMAVGFACS